MKGSFRRQFLTREGLLGLSWAVYMPCWFVAAHSHGQSYVVGAILGAGYAAIAWLSQTGYRRPAASGSPDDADRRTKAYLAWARVSGFDWRCGIAVALHALVFYEHRSAVVPFLAASAAALALGWAALRFTVGRAALHAQGSPA